MGFPMTRVYNIIYIYIIYIYIHTYMFILYRYTPRVVYSTNRTVRSYDVWRSGPVPRVFFFMNGILIFEWNRIFLIIHHWSTTDLKGPGRSKALQEILLLNFIIKLLIVTNYTAVKTVEFVFPLTTLLFYGFN